MTGRILVPAEDVWDYIQEQTALYEADDEAFAGFDLAYNDDAGTEVSVDLAGGTPLLMVTEDGEVAEYIPVTKDDCEEIAQMLYDDYISDRVFARYSGHDSDDPMDLGEPPDDDDDVDDDYDEPDDPIEEREFELDDAVYALLLTFLGDEIGDYDEEAVVRETKEHLCSWLTEEYGANIRRPMMLVNDKGEEMLAEYPYEYIA